MLGNLKNIFIVDLIVE